MAKKEAKPKKGKEEVSEEKKPMVKHMDTIPVGKGSMEIYGVKPMGVYSTLLIAVVNDKDGNPVGVSQYVYDNVKPKSKKGNISLVHESAEKAGLKAEKRKEKKDKTEDKEKPKGKKKPGKKED